MAGIPCGRRERVGGRLHPPVQRAFRECAPAVRGSLGATAVEEATASIAGQFDSIFRWDGLHTLRGPPRPWSPPITTLLRGRPVLRDGEFAGALGAGQYIPAGPRTVALAVAAP